MKRIAVISLAVALVLFPTLAMNCGSGGGSENLEGKIKWIETEPLTCLYDPGQSWEGDYQVAMYGEMENVSKHKLKVFSAVFRLYNSAGEVVGEQIFGYEGYPEVRPNQIFSSPGFTLYYAEEVVRYDVFVTDSQGKEYICLRD